MPAWLRAPDSFSIPDAPATTVGDHHHVPPFMNADPPVKGRTVSLSWISLLLLALLWFLPRLPLALNTLFWSHWEIWEARKLLEFGFWERAGALTPPSVMAGHLPYLMDLNYTNHPYGMVWLYTAVYA